MDGMPGPNHDAAQDGRRPAHPAWPSRRHRRAAAGGLLLMLLLTGCARPPRPAPIKVGILHSLSGTMAISEASLVDATTLAIQEINEQGGLLGRRIDAIVRDGRSDEATFALEAERLIQGEHCAVIFGCWTSASRKTVKPVFEKHHHLLFYPVQYEGLEQSPNIVYTGAAPNQQILPAVRWAVKNGHRRFYLVGSDYVFPRTANEILKAEINDLDARVVGEEYLLLGSSEVRDMITRIRDAAPDMIFNTINGDSNVAFFRELRSRGITPDRIPTLSFSIAEDELRILGAADMVGDYAAWNYFQSVRSERNHRFVARFKERYGGHRVVDDPIEAAYFGVYLWARAVEEAGDAAPQMVRRVLSRRPFEAPGGIVYVDEETQHTWKAVRIGKIREDGQFEIVWSSDHPIRPVPYPRHRPNKEWEKFLDDLYRGWGGRWANPGRAGKPAPP